MRRNDDIKVSVYCMAYNHEKYIRDALEGFIMQKTNFKFEVIVHDDASTDGTANIIKEYEQKYPDIIKPIYQSENQISLGIPVLSTYVLPKLRGVYVASCEGDDCWTDENKLQIQHDIMENNPECIFCTHKTRVLDMQNKREVRFFPNESYGLKTGIVDRDVQFEISLFDLFHLTSWFFKKSEVEKFFLNKPEFVKMMPTGDVGRLLYFANIGGMYYIDKEMSLYRKGTEGSWTMRVERNADRCGHIKRNEKIIAALNLLKEDLFDTEFDKMIDRKISECRFAIDLAKKDYKSLFSEEYKEILCHFNKKAVTMFFISRYFPWFEDICMHIRRVLKKI